MFNSSTKSTLKKTISLFNELFLYNSEVIFFKFSFIDLISFLFDKKELKKRLKADPLKISKLYFLLPLNDKFKKTGFSSGFSIFILRTILSKLFLSSVII